MSNPQRQHVHFKLFFVPDNSSYAYEIAEITGGIIIYDRHADIKGI